MAALHIYAYRFCQAVLNGEDYGNIFLVCKQ